MSLLHVAPTADVIAHEMSEDCGCLPWAADGVITHNAWDGRE